MKNCLLIALLILMPLRAWGTTYYISTMGDDANSGTTTSVPWKSIFKLNRTPFAPGDSILFKRGDIWEGADATPIIPSTSGSADHPITWGAYGTGPKPIITFASRRNKNSDWTYEGNNMWSTGGLTLTEKELFTNPSFSRNADGWYNQCSGGGALCSFAGHTVSKGENDSTPGGYKIVVVDHGSSPEKVQLYTASGSPISFIQGRYYLITFRAKSTTTFIIPALVLKSHEDGADITSGMFVQTLRVGTDWSTCTFMFRSDRTLMTAGFNMLLGGSSGIPNGATLYIDSFSCREIEGQDFFGMYYCANLIFMHASGSPTTGTLVQSGILTHQGEWYQSYKDRKIRLYSWTNPAAFYRNDVIIVHGASKSGFWIREKHNHVFQHLDFFALPSAWSGKDFAHVIIQNCNASYAGGIPEVNLHDYNWSNGSFRVRAGGAIGANGNISDWILRYNNFLQSYDANVAWENAEWGGWGKNKKADNIRVYCNILGLAHYNIEFRWAGSGSSMSNVYICNNTLYDAGYEWSVGQRPDEPMQREDAHIKCWDSPSNGTNINIKNNIMDRAVSQMLWFSNWSQWSGILAMNNNLYHNIPSRFASASKVNYHSLAEWRTFSTNDTESLFVDPLFVAAAHQDFRLQSLSPARNAGVDVGLQLDFSGHPVPLYRPSIGAYEYSAL